MIQYGHKFKGKNGGIYYDENGDFMTGGTANGSYKTFDLKKLDKYVEFNKLSSGTYSYVIKATNAYGEEILVNQSYLVY